MKIRLGSRATNPRREGKQKKKVYHVKQQTPKSTKEKCFFFSLFPTSGGWRKENNIFRHHRYTSAYCVEVVLLLAGDVTRLRNPTVHFLFPTSTILKSTEECGESDDPRHIQLTEACSSYYSPRIKTKKKGGGKSYFISYLIIPNSLSEGDRPFFFSCSLQDRVGNVRRIHPHVYHDV